MQIYENISLENIDGEKWLQITNYPSYEVSNMGRVKSFSKSTIQILRQSINNNGYLSVAIANMAGRKTIKVHRLVGIMFLNNPNLYKEINHIDSDKKK